MRLGVGQRGEVTSTMLSSRQNNTCPRHPWKIASASDNRVTRVPPRIACAPSTTHTSASSRTTAGQRRAASDQMSHARHTALNATATQPKTGANSGSMRGDWLKATAMTMANEPSTTATNSGHVSGRPGAGRPGRGRTAEVVQKKRIMINPVRMKASHRWPCSSR